MDLLAMDTESPGTIIHSYSGMHADEYIYIPLGDVWTFFRLRHFDLLGCTIVSGSRVAYR